MHERFSGVWICKDLGRTTTEADPAELGRTLLAAYLASRDNRGETFRVVVHAGNGSQSVITPADLTRPGWTADPAICQALPAYLRGTLA
ncbi:hypothetical protein [Streptomyces bungoensis]|uniref:hypothetical protein n=1 Tax=Streptomyces bungoensis TaxID=285568 RepID=UPI0034023C33